MTKVHAHKIRMKGKTYEQFRTNIPMWVIKNLKLKHKGEIEFELNKSTGGIEIRKKKDEVIG